MSIVFPSSEFFRSLQESLERDPTCTEAVEPSEAYCGFAIDDRLYVLEFDGRTCAGATSGGNELDLDFVLAGPSAVWRRVLEALASDEADVIAGATLPALVEEGALEIRSQDEDGPSLARAALPFLQVFLERARGLEIAYA